MIRYIFGPSRAFPEPSKTSKMVLSGKRVNDSEPSTIFTKSSILDDWLGLLYLTPFNPV